MVDIKRHSLRLAATAALGTAALALAATTAVAAPAAAQAATVTAAPSVVAVRASITATPSVTSVKAWQLFRVTGKTTGLRPGAHVTLQQKQHGRWVTLPVTVQVNRSGGYAMHVKLGLLGRNELRIVSGSVASPVFTVTVR